MGFVKIKKKQSALSLYVQFSEIIYGCRRLCRILLGMMQKGKICALLPQFHRSSSIRTQYDRFYLPQLSFRLQQIQFPTMDTVSK